MKDKIISFGIIIVLSIILAGVVFVHADESNLTNSSSSDNNSVNTTIENETNNEVEIMISTNLGAQMRIYQLRRSLEIKIFEARAVRDYIENKGNDTSSLDSIIVELQVLNSSLNNVSFNNKTEAVQSFVDIKSQSRDLVNQFRQEAVLYLNETDKGSLRAQFIQIEKDRLQNLKDEINELRKQVWEEQIRGLFGIFGRNESFIIEKIRNQTNLTDDELRKRLNQEFGNLSQQEKDKAQSKMIEEFKSRERERINALEEIQKNQRDRLQSSLQMRAQILKERGLLNKSERAQNFSEKMQERFKLGGENGSY